MTKILNPRLFEAVYKAVKRRADVGDFPQAYLPARAYVERASDKKFVSLAPNGLISKTSAVNGLIIRDANSDANRFTGTSPVPAIKNQGGLYVYKHEEAGLAEFMHYGENMKNLPINVGTKRISVPHLMATKAVFRIRTLKPFILANISPFSGEGYVQKFLNDIENDASVKSLLGGVSLINKILDPNDYSAGRAVGLAFGTINYVGGLQSQTARSTERYDTTGDNICLFGANGAPVPNLEVEAVTLTFSPDALLDNDDKEIKLNSADETAINTFLPNWTSGENSVLIEVDTGFKMGMRVVK